MVNISSIFAKSPFKPLHNHMDKVVESVAPLENFFNFLFLEDFLNLEKIKDQIIEAEDAADSIKNEMRNHLPQNIFMPINRRDLLEILDMQDSIADVSQDIVVLLEQRKMKLNKGLHVDVIDFVKKSQQVCFLTRDLIHEFGYLIESGFGLNESKKMFKMIDNISFLETEADSLEDTLVERLYGIEKDMYPVDVMFWYKVFELIGDIADFSKKTSNRLRLTIASK